jgi:predicted DNA-binding mobile mystery protein A
MDSDFTDLRRRQLDRSLAPFQAARQEPRPRRGWLRAIREGLGLTLAEMGAKARESRQHVLRFEKAEVNDNITLGSLRRLADAMDCELVYAIVPKSGTISELAERLARGDAEEKVRRVARTMALEGQGTTNTEDLIQSKIRDRHRR